MKWHKRDAVEHRKAHVVELWQRHGFKGIFFWDHLNDLFAEYFNFWCPGCYQFKTSIFYAFFQPQIKDPRFIRKMLEFLSEEKIITISLVKGEVYIYYPDIIKKADRYTQARLKDAEDRKLEQPKSARNLASRLLATQEFNASGVYFHANDSIDIK